MSTKNEDPERFAESVAALRDIFPKGSTVYTTVRDISDNGVIQMILTLQVTPSGEIENVSSHVARVIEMPYSTDHHGVMSRRINRLEDAMSFSVVHQLARVLHGDGRALQHRRV